MEQGKAQGNFSEGKIASLILNLAIPMTVAELVNVLYNIVDRMYLGHMEGVGTAALTGLGICLPLISLTAAFAAICSSGGAPLMTIARGEGNDELAGRIESTSFCMLLSVGAVLTALFSLTAPWLLSLLGGDSSSLPAALEYYRIYVLGTIPVMISLGMNSFINAQGFPKTGMVTVALGAAINLLLDPLMIYTLGLGIRGAALATLISQSASAVWAVLFLTGKRPPVPLRRLVLDRHQLNRILKLGVTGFTFKATNSITQALVNVTLKAWGGEMSTLYIGAMSLINTLREIAMLPHSGLVNGMQSVVSYNYGARKYRRVDSAIRFGFFGCLCCNLLIWGIILLFPQTLGGIFSSDPALIALTARCARIYFAVYPMMTLQSIGQSTFVAMNCPRHALFFSLLRKVLLIVPLTLLLPALGFGAEGVFWAEACSQLIGATACFTTMYLIVWRRLKAAPDGSELLLHR